ncbi:MAG: nicotinate phosphoribosyltransferase [Polyangiales bacterium]
MSDVVSPLLTDLYQLTMAQGYYRARRADDRAVFHLGFRRPPFAGGYALAAGLEPALTFVADYRFSADEIAYLGALPGDDGAPLFAADFLAFLRDLRLDVDIDAMPEGTVAFGQEPLLRVQGSLIACQLIETTLLNTINFQTLIATKAARVCEAAGAAPVLEFGLRRAQGVDGALAASRAAYIGGCSATSNVLAGKRYGIPVRGTHAHSWVMAFDSEPEAFAAYADAMPNNCVLLVDTYDTLTGVRHAIDVGLALRARGKKLLGIRLDSGDLAWLSIEARKLLDAAGLADATIFASNDLDEHVITSLRQQGAQIGAWAVGTRLVTGHDQPALGGVYKLAMIAHAGKAFEPRIKLSEQATKISNPGAQQVRRFSREGRFVADVIYDAWKPERPTVLVDPFDATRRRTLRRDLDHEDLLQPVVRAGARVSTPESLATIRARATTQREGLDPTIRRFANPHEYPVGLSKELFEERMLLIERARGVPEA